MKRIILTLLLSVTLAAHAKPVDMSTLLQVATRFCAGQTVQMQMQRIGNEMALFQWDGGFVLLAIDDCVRPVLAYSTTNSISLDDMPANLEGWLEGYRQDIAAKVAAGIDQTPQVAAEWAHYTGAMPAPKTVADSVAPLLTTRWSQRPYYNALCPYNANSSALSVTGCVATATAQIMKYWNHPAVGWGSESYQLQPYGTLTAQFDTTHYRWDLMPYILTATSDTASIMAVAELMYHVGVAVHMQYSPEASGAHISDYGVSGYPSAETALRTHFRYSQMLHSIFKTDYTDDAWSDIMRDEIAALRPVLYSGYDADGGHAFVLDGYDTLGFFHINWGWGGLADGYFTIDSLSPGIGGTGGNTTYTFNENNHAVVGIEPTIMSTADSVVVDMRFDPAMGTVDGNGTYATGDEIVTVVARGGEGKLFDHWASGASVNPIEFLTNNDLSDSAIFTAIRPSDTIGYCINMMKQTWQDDWSSVTEWGIRIPASMRKQNRSVSGVQLYVYRGYSYFTFSVYQGDSICDATLLHTEEIPVYDSYQWVNIDFGEPVPVANNGDVWLTVSHDGYDYPATHTVYCGNSDGSWYHLPDGWAPYDRHGLYATWMLRGVFTEREADPEPPAGIDVAEDQLPHVEINGRTVSIDTDADIYDATGRQLASNTRQWTAAAPGVYILRAGACTKKIVII